MGNYQPTGRPPGRPRKNPEPEPEQESRACGECFPGDQGFDLYRATCPHGDWQNPRLTAGRCVAR